MGDEIEAKSSVSEAIGYLADRVLKRERPRTFTALSRSIGLIATAAGIIGIVLVNFMFGPQPVESDPSYSLYATSMTVFTAGLALLLAAIIWPLIDPVLDFIGQVVRTLRSKRA